MLRFWDRKERGGPNDRASKDLLIKLAPAQRQPLRHPADERHRRRRRLLQHPVRAQDEAGRQDNLHRQDF